VYQFLHQFSFITLVPRGIQVVLTSVLTQLEAF